MSNWDSIPIRDYAGTSRSVGTFLVDGVNHPSAILAAGLIVETTGLTLTSGAPIEVTIDPLSTYLMIDLGTQDGTSIYEFQVSARYSAAGDYYAVPVYRPVEAEAASRTLTSSSQANTYLRWDPAGVPSLNSGERVLFIPVAGLKQVKLATGSGTSLAGIAIRQMAGPYPPFMQPPSRLMASAYESFTPTNLSYTAGKVIGGTAIASISYWSSRLSVVSPILRKFSISDYQAQLDDFDIVICYPDSSSLLADNDDLNLNYSESLVAVLEFRTSPTAGQYKTHDVGPDGGFAAVANGLELHIDYTDLDTTPSISTNAFDAILVARGSITFPSPDNIYFEAQVELS